MRIRLLYLTFVFLSLSYPSFGYGLQQSTEIQIISKSFNVIATSTKLVSLTDEVISPPNLIPQINDNPISKQSSGSAKGLSQIYLAIGIMLLIVLFVLLLFRNKKLKKNYQTHISELNDKNELLRLQLIDRQTAVKIQVKQSTDALSEELAEKNKAYPKLEQALEYAKQSEFLKDNFLAKLSHEVRSPLTNILGFTSLLETELAMMENQELYEFASTITQSGQSLIDLLNNLFDLSLINSNKLELNPTAFDINQVLQESVLKFEALASQKGIRVVLSPSPIDQVYTDKKLIQNMLSMILDNAVRFTEKGYIKIKSKPSQDNSQIMIQIQDTGIGIDKAYIKDVFEPYRKEKLGYSTLYQGAGLSLPLTKKMIEVLGGSISIDSEKGVGTTVSITFPVKYQAQSVSKDEMTENNNATSHDKKIITKQILLVEPDELTQLLILKMLNRLAHVQTVKNQKNAIDLITAMENTNQHFDLVIMDVNLNELGSSSEFLQKLRTVFITYENTPIIALTAYSLSDEPRDLVEKGFKAYVTKPIMKQNLLNAVNQTLNIDY